MFSLSPESDESFWPALPNSQDQNYAVLYRGYKRLVNSIAEKLRKTEVLSLVYQYDLPMWYSEVGPLHEPGLALRVLSRMEGMQVFSPTRLSELAQSLEEIGRADLSETIRTFQSQHKAITDQMITSDQATEQFTRTEYGRRSYNNPRRIRRSPSDGYCNNVIPCQETVYPHTQSNSCQNSMEYLNQSRETTPFDIDEKDGPRSESLQKEGISTRRPTFLFNNSKDTHMSITMTLFTAEMLEKQMGLLKQNLAGLCLVSPDLHKSLTSAYFLTRQVTSHLNIAAANLQLTENSTTRVPTHPVQGTHEPEYHLRVFNEQSPLSSPRHSSSNSLQDVEIHNTTSRASLPDTNNYLSPQQPLRPIYRSSSQPITKMSPMREMPVMDPESYLTANVHEKEEQDAFSPIDNREGVIGNLLEDISSQTTLLPQSYSSSLPRETTPPVNRHINGSSVISKGVLVHRPGNMKNEKGDSPKSNGHWTIRPSTSDHSINQLVNNNPSKTKYSQWTLKLRKPQRK